MITSKSATGQGLVAVFLWAALASMTVAIAAIPPFQRLAVSFAVGTLASFAYLLWAGERPLQAARAAPGSYWALGVFGLLGYHAAYFYALSGPAPLQANLLNYLWPLLITIFAARAGESGDGTGAPRWRVVAGAVIGFMGTAVALGAKDLSQLPAGALQTLAAAGVAAIIWAAYSVSLRRYAAIPSSTVAVLCGLSAMGAFVLHLMFETPVWALDLRQWTILVAQGIGPVGLAFTFWDAAMKHGNAALLGAVAYTVPIASTAILVLSGQVVATPMLWLSAVMVAAGAALASYRSNFP